MEEILASIRRIISEDETPKAAATKEEPPLELARPAPKAEPPATDGYDDLMVFEEKPPQPAPAKPPVRPAPPTAAAMHVASSEDIVSPPAVDRAAGSFTRLAGSLKISDQPGQTVEGVVRELLRPMLKEWLDQHLPAIVEAKVEAELDRISRLAR
jgi:hypothetical protein